VLDPASDTGPLGLLVIGHGTRDQLGLGQFDRLARMVADRLPDLVVQPCFLELAEPTIGAGVQQLVDRGLRRAIALPLFLNAGAHILGDVPAMLADAVEKTGRRMQVRLARHLGCHRWLLEASAERFREAVADRAPEHSGPTVLVMVGHGSRERSATEELRRFSGLRQEMTPVTRSEVCFLNMAEPLLETTLSELIAEPLDDSLVVVQPHLLFEGKFVREIQRQVAEAARRRRHVTWIVADHLGPSELLANALVDNCLAEIRAGWAAGRCESPGEGPSVHGVICRNRPGPSGV
jgi:sirohydrochlorin cobaltochelatase